MSGVRSTSRKAQTVFEDYDFATNMINSTVQIPMTMPSMLRFSTNSLLIVVAYCVCFAIATVGNLAILLMLSRGRHRKSRISLMICHLSFADLIVTFFMIPIEVARRITIQWIAGNMACKIFSFLRIFGLYLSSNILICVSIDRYFAVLHPLRVNAARRRGKIMLLITWICSAIYAAPQSFIFRVSVHRNDPTFQQCDAIGFFTSKFEETCYTLFCITAMYFVPLIVITYVYIGIFCEINKKTRESITGPTSDDTLDSGGRLKFRRSHMRNIERARNRTLCMAITIVTFFMLCWTPYVLMVLWYIIDKQSAETVDQRVQDFVYIMAVTNSCVNPIVHGGYAVDLRRECLKCFAAQDSSNNVIRKSRQLAKKNRNVELLDSPPCESTTTNSAMKMNRTNAKPKLRQMVNEPCCSS